MVHATFKKKPQKLRAEGGTPTKQSPDRTIVAASRGECRREPASKAKSLIAPMLLRGCAACDAPRRWAQNAPVGVPTQEHGNHQTCRETIQAAPPRRMQAQACQQSQKLHAE